MQRRVLSSDDVPEGERFVYWRDEALASVGVSFEAQYKKTPFNAKVESWVSETVARFRYRSDGIARFAARTKSRAMVGPITSGSAGIARRPFRSGWA